MERHGRTARQLGLFLLLFAIRATDVLAQQAAVQAAAAPSRSTTPLKCNQGHLQVTLGLLREQALVLSAASESASRETGICGAVARARNEYELLSMLENGGVQAAVVPEFVVDVMKADDPAKFQRDYIELPTTVLRGIPASTRSLIVTDASRNPVQDAAAQLALFYEALRVQSVGPTIEVPSHLSGAVRAVLEDADQWARKQLLSNTDRGKFLGAILGAMRFSFSASCGQDAVAPKLRIVETVREGRQLQGLPGAFVDLPPDRLVVRKQVFLNARDNVQRLLANAAL